MIQTSNRLRRSGAALGIGALVASALMFAPAAQAATDVNVTNADIKPNAADYVPWHQGYAINPTGAKVTAKGLELSGGPSQVIKGYADNNNTIAPAAANRNFDIASKIAGAKFTATEGTANLQVPIFYDLGAGVKFTTLRSLNDQGSRIKTSDLWASSSAIASTTPIAKDAEVPLTELLAAIGSNYKVIALGVQADNNAVVTDITWDGVTYKFKDPIDKVVAPPVVKLKSSVDIYRVNPVSGQARTKSKVSVYASVRIDSARAPRGTVVDVYAKGKKVGTGTVNGSGKVKATLTSKLPRGKSTLKIALPDSSTVVGSDDSVKVSIKK